MSRRVSLPGADELFRTTGPFGSDPVVPGSEPGGRDAPGAEASASVASIRTPLTAAEPADERSAQRPRAGVRQSRPRAVPAADRRPSGRERHDEKITVYLSPDELIDLEHARLALRQHHGMAVDRGRIVREALALVLAELEAKGESSTLVRRLREP